MMEEERTQANEQATSEEIQNEKRKRATAGINFEKFTNDEAEEATPQEAGEHGVDGEPPKKKARTYAGMENLQEYDLLQGRQMLQVLSAAFPEVAKRVMKDKQADEYEDVIEINTAINDIRYLQAIKSGTNINMWLGGMGLQAIEDLATTFTPMKLKGLGNCSRDPEFQELWKEVSIDLMTLKYMDPKTRMLLYLGKSAYILHHVNTSIDESGPPYTQPSSKNPRTVEKPAESE